MKRAGPVVLREPFDEACHEDANLPFESLRANGWHIEGLRTNAGVSKGRGPFCQSSESQARNLADIMTAF